ncbi:MAG: hypothetical protein E4G95_01730 [Bacteroidia bacterium]|nr:MAG: hypothetical protein E4G95_01730 [Bacteroidia bacterium]
MSKTASGLSSRGIQMMGRPNKRFLLASLRKNLKILIFHPEIESIMLASMQGKLEYSKPG